MAELSMSGRSVVASFAASLGLDAAAAADGSYNFVFERMGTLSIAPTADSSGTVVALARSPRTNESSGERRLLAMGGFDQAANRLIYVAMAEDGSHILATDLDETRWGLPELDEILRYLGRLHDAVN